MWWLWFLSSVCLADRLQCDGEVQPPIAGCLTQLAWKRTLGEDSVKAISIQPPGSQDPLVQWSAWTEVLVLCLSVLALGIATCCLEPFIASLSRSAFSLLLCCLYTAISVLIDVFVRAAGDGAHFEPMCAVVLTEFIKFLVSLSLAMSKPVYLEGGTPSLGRRDVMWLVLAAAIFTLNNILLWWAIGESDTSTLEMLRDTMILWTVFFWRGIFGVPLGWTRLAGIFVVFMGLMLNQIQLREPAAALSWAAALILATACAGGLGAVVSEVALKQRHGMLDINVQNSFLYCCCMLFTALAMLLSDPFHSVYQLGFFYGFTRYTMFTVCLQALAGLSLSRILKYADAMQANIAFCLRGPILVLLLPALDSMANITRFFSASIIACGCIMYLMQGPLMVRKAI